MSEESNNKNQLSYSETIRIFTKIRNTVEDYLSYNCPDWYWPYSNECIEEISRIIKDEFYRVQNAAIKSVESLVSKGEFDEARVAIAKYRKDGIDVIEFSMLEARMARLLILADNEEDD